LQHGLKHFGIGGQRHVGDDAGQQHLAARTAKHGMYLWNRRVPRCNLSGLPVQAGNIVVAQDIGRILVINSGRNFLAGSPFFTAAIRVKSLETKL
jgi:hypothetical protein